MDAGLSDYKDSDFIKIRTVDNILLSDVLTSGEKEFVNMIGCMWRQGNDIVKLKNYRQKYTTSAYSYAIIDKVIEYLDNGKIVDAYFSMTGGGAHAVNVYDYYYDIADKNVIWLKIYDNNFPANSNKSGYANCTMKITKVWDRFHRKYVFSYDYYPVPKAIPNYRATSNLSFFDSYSLVFIDSDWNIINDMIK